jgi:predicted membrane chloride channel (bestrophin family)
MPMAYVQVMEVLVDTLCVLAPLALYTKMGTFNIVSTGLLTLFFKGLLELSKSFLDPFGREGYTAHNISKCHHATVDNVVCFGLRPNSSPSDDSILHIRG